MRVIVNFQLHLGWQIHTIAEDCRTVLGPFMDVSSEQTLVKLFRYLGATEEALAGAVNDLKQWSRGGIHIDVPEDRLRFIGVRSVSTRYGPC